MAGQDGVKILEQEQKEQQYDMFLRHLISFKIHKVYVPSHHHHFYSNYGTCFSFKKIFTGCSLVS
jgi:hypothetical protein